jgi:signal transduction histidine kinase
MTKPMMDAVTPADMPTMDDPETFAMALAQSAIDLYKTEGREAMIAYHNSPASINGQWYVFITDENNIYLAHPVKPEFGGKDITQIPGIAGTPIGTEIAMATEEGRWTEYLWPNPDTNKLEQKRTWSIRYDGYLFAAGYYVPWTPDPATFPVVSKDDPKAFTHAVVLGAIARYELGGIETTATYYNDPANIDGQWYVFITDEHDLFVAHAPRPDFVGTDLKDVIGLDGSPLGINIAKATGVGLWIEYLWPNPETGADERKRTWAIRHDGYLFGSGYYESVPEDAPTIGEAAAP